MYGSIYVLKVSECCKLNIKMNKALDRFKENKHVLLRQLVSMRVRSVVCNSWFVA